MRIDSEAVRHAARLARIPVAEAEVDGLARQLAGVLEHLRVLASVAPGAVEPGGAGAAELPSGGDGLRSDEPWPGLDHTALGAMVPAWHPPLVLAPSNPALSVADGS